MTSDTSPEEVEVADCDGCGQPFPFEALRYLPFGLSNSAGDGSFCAECRSEPADSDSISDPVLRDRQALARGWRNQG